MPVSRRFEMEIKEGFLIVVAKLIVWRPDDCEDKMSTGGGFIQTCGAQRGIWREGG